MYMKYKINKIRKKRNFQIETIRNDTFVIKKIDIEMLKQELS